MRWPFRTRSAAASSTATSAPARPARSDRRAWQSLAPIAPVVTRPRLTVGRPEVVGSRSLLHRAEPPRREERPAGRVTGLADVLTALDTGYEESATPAGERPVPVIPRTPAGSPLTSATPEYVGEARVPAEPHRAPGWLRALSAGPMLDPLLGSVLAGAAPNPSGQFPPLSSPAGRSAPMRPSAATPPRPAPLGAAGTTAPRPVRRAGRLGLGAPLRPAASDPESDPEPDPAAPPNSATPVVAGPPPPAAAARSTTVPADLAREVGAAAGADVEGVLVHRGPEIDRRAGELGAVAFTVDDGVHLGAAAGPDDGPVARALVAHELAHVAQQRRLGAALPDEATPAGAELEAEALAVEDAVRAGRSLPRLTHPGPPVHPPSGSADARPRPPVQGSLFLATIDVAAPVGGSFRGPVSGAAATLASPSLASPSLASPPLAGPASVRRALVGPASPAPGADGPQRGEPGAPGGVGRGRVQRRTVERSHPPTPAPAAQPESPPSPALPPPVAPVPDPAPAAPTPSTTDNRPSVSAFGQQMTSELGAMVLSSWSLEETHDTPAAAGRTSDDSREARFNRIAGPALARLNEQRLAAGQPELPALPEDEERRIWDQVDQGAGGGPAGNGSGQRHDQAIRNWSDFGGAVTNDMTEQIGGSFGVDLAEVIHHPGPAQAGSTMPAAQPETAAPTDPHGDPGHHGERASIDTDDLDLDELGHRLYDRIRSRLRLELLLDRERAGLLSDFR